MTAEDAGMQVEDRGGILMWVGGKMLFDDGESAPT